MNKPKDISKNGELQGMVHCTFISMIQIKFTSCNAQHNLIEFNAIIALYPPHNCSFNEIENTIFKIFSCN